MRYAILFALFSYSFTSWSQTRFYQINGMVKPSAGGKILDSVKVCILETPFCQLTTAQGAFAFNNLTENRVILSFEKVGFQMKFSEAILLDKWTTNYYLEELNPLNSLPSIEVVASKLHPGNPVNALAYVSTRSFSADDTEHVPASVNDPGRMSLSFMGVQGGRDENENKIIIRGNSPQGVLWRVEGLDIPNPNHFARPGASGGGLSIFSAQLLDRSDFSIGGMSAEYGNAIAGAFDIHFRDGHLDKRRSYFRAGLLGIDVSTEGPIKQGKSSYLVNYRYSTLGLYNQLQIYLTGERTLNTFQDLSFNTVFYSKNGRNRTTIFGVGGKSDDLTNPVKNPLDRNPAFADDWEEQRRNSSTGILGITHQLKINSNTNLRLAIAATGSSISRRFDTLDVQDIRFRYNTEDYLDKRITATAVYDKVVSKRFKYKAGLIGHFINYAFLRETYPRGSFTPGELQVLRNVFFDGNGNTQTGQAYFNTETRFSSKWKMQAGLHYMRLFLNGRQSLEPRFALNFKPKERHQLAFSYGLYSQLLPLTTYFTVNRTGSNEFGYVNPNVNFPQSHHFIGRYQYNSKGDWTLVMELYLQRLQRVQISPSGGFFWMLNFSDGFADGPTITKGTGFNYGIDILLERYFNKNYYFLLTTSLFNAKYRTLEPLAYNSSFNDNWGTNLTTGREFKGKRCTWQIGVRGMFNGGFRYSPLDSEASARLGFFNPIVSEFNTLQAPMYYRIDSRLAAKFKMGKASATASLDIQNVSAYNNYSRFRYNRSENNIFLEQKGVGLVPIFSFGVGW